MKGMSDCHSLVSNQRDSLRFKTKLSTIMNKSILQIIKKSLLWSLFIFSHRLISLDTFL